MEGKKQSNGLAQKVLRDTGLLKSAPVAKSRTPTDIREITKGIKELKIKSATPRQSPKKNNKRGRNASNNSRNSISPSELADMFGKKVKIAPPKKSPLPNPHMVLRPRKKYENTKGNNKKVVKKKATKKDDIDILSQFVDGLSIRDKDGIKKDKKAWKPGKPRRKIPEYHIYNPKPKEPYISPNWTAEEFLEIVRASIRADKRKIDAIMMSKKNEKV